MDVKSSVLNHIAVKSIYWVIIKLLSLTLETQCQIVCIFKYSFDKLYLKWE